MGGRGPRPGVSACPSLPSRPRDKASPGQTEGRVIGPGGLVWGRGVDLLAEFWGAIRSSAGISQDSGGRWKEAPERKRDPLHSRWLSESVCLRSPLSVGLSRTRRPGFAFWLRRMPSVAQAGTELDSSAKVFPSGATLAHSPKALSGTGSGKGDEEEWSGRREPVCLPACLPACGLHSAVVGRPSCQAGRICGCPLVLLCRCLATKFSLSMSSGDT